MTGTIVVVDEHGDEHPRESGSFNVFFSTGENFHDTHVEVESGRWSADVPPNAGITAQDIRLGDREACWIHEGDWLRTESGAVVELRARWPGATILHIRDSETHRELANVQLVVGHHWLWTSTRTARDAWRREIGDNVTSPIDVGQAMGKSTFADEFCARSPGYAWGRVLLDLSTGGERFLDLHPGGDLDVQLNGNSNLGDASLVLRRAESGDLYETAFLASTGLIRIPSLDPGRYVVTVQFGNFESPTVLGSAPAEIVAGTRTKIEIDLAPTATPDRVTLAGIVRVPKAWKTAQLYMWARYLDNAAELSDRDLYGTIDWPTSDGEFDVYSFEMNDVLPGRYVFGVSPTEYRAAINLGDKGADDVVLEIPPPAHVSLRALDAATGEDAALDSIVWRQPLDDDAAEGGRGARRDPTTGRFEFDAPAGEIVVSPGFFAFGIADEPFRFAVHAGRNEVEWRVTPICGFRLRAQDGDVAVPWDAAWRVRVEPIEHDGREVSKYGYQGTLVVTLSKPGRYRVSLSKPDGFRAIADQDVVVEPRRFVDHSLLLERE